MKRFTEAYPVRLNEALEGTKQIFQMQGRDLWCRNNRKDVQDILRLLAH
jgi:hypothetical protein